jgi:hypothetical protein
MHRVFFSLLLSFGLLAAGQGGDGRDVLLQALARYSETEMRNLEREQRNIFYGQDGEHPTMEMHWRSLVDFEHRRLVNEDYAGGRVIKRTSYVNGTARVVDLVTGSVSEMADDEHYFDGILAGDATWPARGLPEAVYEGRMRYLDLVEGEQFAIPGDSDKYLFDSSGHLIARVIPGAVSDSGAPTDIKLYEDERRVNGFWFSFLIRSYHLEGGEATLVQEVHVLEIKVNQNLNTAHFALGAD